MRGEKAAINVAWVENSLACSPNGKNEVTTGRSLEGLRAEAQSQIVKLCGCYNVLPSRSTEGKCGEDALCWRTTGTPPHDATAIPVLDVMPAATRGRRPPRREMAGSLGH